MIIISKINAIPKSIRNKLKKLHSISIKLSEVDRDIVTWVESHGVNMDFLDASRSEVFSDEEHTEAYAFFLYGECEDDESIEEMIDEVERVFLYHANKQ